MRIRKCKGTKTTLTLGHKCKKYRSRFLNKNQLDCTEGNIQSPSASVSNLDTSHESILSHPSESANSEHFEVIPCGKQTSEISIQTRPIVTANKFTQAEHLSICSHDVFMQTEGQERNQKSQSTQYNFCDFLTGKKLQSQFNLNKIIDFFNDPEIGIKFTNQVESNGKTAKFLCTIKFIAMGKLKCSNMSWKAALDMGYLSSCETTSKMVYDKEWLEFCQVVYHMFGGSIINTLQGRAHFSHVTSEKSSKGLFKPIEGEFNFPVPCITTLKKLDIG